MIPQGRFNFVLMSPDARRARHKWNPSGFIPGYVATAETEGESDFHLSLIGAAIGFALAIII